MVEEIGINREGEGDKGRRAECLSWKNKGLPLDGEKTDVALKKMVVFIKMKGKLHVRMRGVKF